MIRLEPYSVAHEAQTASRMAQFFGFHLALVPETQSSDAELCREDGEEIRKTLAEWLLPPSHLFVVMADDVSVGFIRICFRGPSVAWIEDIFIDPDHRGRGIATSAIHEAERFVMDTPGYTAVCLDVAPRNASALALYHRLGYIDISLITIRKELDGGHRENPIRLLDLDFRY